MSVVASDVVAGKCFATSTNQVRQILEVQGSKVKYQSRGKKAGEWTNRVEVDLAKFVDDVDREVSCDYDPNFSE